MAAPGGSSIKPTHGGAVEIRKISLVVADVDGTLVTEQKVLTQRARAAVQALHRAGIRFAITSGRPPRSIAMLFDALALETPIAGFNGGLFVRRDPVDPRTENGGTGHCPSGPRAHLRAWISTVRQMRVDGVDAAIAIRP
jgi:hydroxymethylpyrimidine pyrophosphatase-like HAD family hydrolase